MIEIKLGTRYAKSILELAREKGVVEEVYNDFLFIDDLCAQNPDFVIMLKSPLINPGKKRSIIKKILGGKVSQMTENFLDILVRKNREGYIRDIADRFKALYDNLNNITRGTLISATELNEQQKERITDIIEKDFDTNFELSTEVNPDLIGGFVLKIGDRLFDGSVSASLRQIQREFENSQYVKG